MDGIFLAFYCGTSAQTAALGAGVWGAGRRFLVGFPFGCGWFFGAGVVAALLAAGLDPVGSAQSVSLSHQQLGVVPCQSFATQFFDVEGSGWGSIVHVDRSDRTGSIAGRRQTSGRLCLSLRFGLILLLFHTT